MSEVTNSVMALLFLRGQQKKKPQTAVSATPGQTLPTGEKKKKRFVNRQGGQISCFHFQMAGGHFRTVQNKGIIMKEGSDWHLFKDVC